MAWLFIGLPGGFILQLYLSRFRTGWITPVVGCILLVTLIIIGVRREGRRSRPVPPPRPPGHEIDEPTLPPPSGSLRGQQAA